MDVQVVRAGMVGPAAQHRLQRAFGLRLPFLGPLETADLAGLDLVYDIHEYLFPELENRTTPSPLLKRLVAEKKMGVKTKGGLYPWTDETINRIIRQRDKALLRISEAIKELDLEKKE